MISIFITYCGFNAYASVVKDGFANYLKTISRDECSMMHTSGSWKYSYSGIANDIKPNSTTLITPLLSGRLYGESDCTGGSYTDSHGTWENVIVQSSITITLNDYMALADTTDGVINLKSGTSRKLIHGTCIDSLNGWTFWETTPINQCDPRLHIVLYVGPASVIKSNSNTSDESHPTTNMAETSSRAFAFQTRGFYLGCFFKTYTTEHPKLVIVPSSGDHFFFTKQPTTVSSLDLMAYMNSKFVYVERKHAKEIATLYHELSTQRCALEHHTLTNLLALAVLKPIEFAYIYMNAPGYTAFVEGEVIHLAQCQAVGVKLRPSTRCYHELPVVYGNKTIFMTPRSHLLQEYGTEL